MNEKSDVWITGIGLLSSLGEGADTHWLAFSSEGNDKLQIDEQCFAPYPIHPLGDVDFASQIKKRGDLRQMEPWQRIGTYSAGLALEDAGLAGNLEMLDTMDMIVAAGSGERDTKMDRKVLESEAGELDKNMSANEILPSELRPTLFLAQLSNLLAGNISIVHKVTGSSRTYMGEEMAGLAALENAFARISSGQSELMLVGGANNAEREDNLLIFELGQNLWSQKFKTVFERFKDREGGIVAGSVGAFLVLESAQHAKKRGAKPYAKLDAIQSGRGKRDKGQVETSLKEQFAKMETDIEKGNLGVFSGAGGTKQATSEEIAFLTELPDKDISPIIRGYGSLLGHSFEAQMPAGVALAALALSKGKITAPMDDTGVELLNNDNISQMLVTSVGHWRGEGLAFLKAIDENEGQTHDK